MDVRPRLSAPPLIEILVHASGPSAARDDLRYRAQAAAYLDFEPYCSKSLRSTEQQAAGVSDPVGAEGIDREAPLDAASAATAPGSAEKKDLPFWNTVLEARDENPLSGPDTESPATSGSAILRHYAASRPNASTLPATDKLDQVSHTIAIPQLFPQITPSTGVPLSSQGVLERERESVSSDAQPPVHIQTSSSRPEDTTPPYSPSAPKRQRILSPDRHLQNGLTKAGASNTGHPCSHSFSITGTENHLNCDACSTGPYQDAHLCNKCKQNFCNTCHSIFLRGQRDQTAVTAVTNLPPGRKQRGRLPRRISTLSPQIGKGESTPFAPRYACHHSYSHTATGPDQSLLVCTTCSSEVPGGFKCSNCRSMLCRQCHHRFMHPRIRPSPPKPRLLAPKQLAPSALLTSPALASPPPLPLPPAPPVIPPLTFPPPNSHPPLAKRRQQHLPPTRPKPSRSRNDPPRAPPPKISPLAQLRNLLPAEPLPSKSSSYPRSPSPPPRIIEIHPPPPPTSTSSSEPPPLITASLQLLASKMSLQKYFSPEYVSRRLRPMERGYWRIPITTWDASIKDQFWRFLEEFVGNGRAGWGVWVSRTLESVDWGVKNRDNKGVGASGGSMGVEFVRVYCWGEVVGYVWLVMIIASERRVKASGCCWVDGGEQVVIRMA